MRSLPSAFFCFSAVLVLFLASGCQSTSKQDKVAHFQPLNYQAVPSIPADVQRVVVLPSASDGTITEETLNALDAVILKALNQTRRFECVPMSRDTCARFTRQRSIRSVDSLPHDFFPRIANEYAASAILFVDVTHYSAFPPLALGLRAKLARLDNRTMLWSFDEIFSANQPEVAAAARHFWEKTMTVETPSNLGASGVQSPSRFAAYVAYTAFQTLPQRYK